MKKNQIIILIFLIIILSLTYIGVYKYKTNILNKSNNSINEISEEACPVDFEKEVEPCE